jgi:hypothetical protein
MFLLTVSGIVLWLICGVILGDPPLILANVAAGTGGGHSRLQVAF